MVWKSSFEVMHLERQIKVDKKLTLRRTNGLQDETQAETERQTSRRLKMEDGTRRIPLNHEKKVAAF